MRAFLPRRVSATPASCLSSSIRSSPVTSYASSSSYRAFSSTKPSLTSGLVSQPPSTPLPTAGFLPLASRRLLSLSGADAPKFLNGLITASVYADGSKNTQTVRDRGFYAGFLSARGRVMQDVFVFPDHQLHGVPESKRNGLSPDEAFLLDIDRGLADSIVRLMKMHKLRSRVSYRLLDEGECGLWSAWNEQEEEAAAAAAQAPQQGLLSSLGRYDAQGAYVVKDERAPGMGYRLLLPGDSSPQFEGGVECAASVHRVRRYLRGVPEGSAEIQPDKALPMEANMDLMGGINFRKGCYVGQELTIRTKHRGVVRKRILPCVVYNEGEPVPSSLEYSPAGDALTTAIAPHTNIRPVGDKARAAEWIAGIGNIGLALCRLSPMTDLPVAGEVDGSNKELPEFEVGLADAEEGKANPRVKAFVPDWMRTQLLQSEKQEAH